MGTRICREPDAVVPHVRFCGGGCLGDRTALLTPHLSGISVPKWQCIQHSHLITGASTMKITTVGI
ncbi:hypothetical protein, partial [Xenorhabdus vietnamensis]|uniref:hypothetical protein n=1 Tax=Xenorhabdus vietnamensis TaxID=351656 RepID=UPI001ABF510B